MENTQNIKDLIQKFYPHAKEKLGFDHPVRVVMRQDAENAKDSLGKTAYYDPAEKLIVLYVTERHPKDVLRSFSHELVHHAQNCRGDLDDLSTDGHYAGDGKGREIEAEAYLLGNGFLVRDWEDGMKHEGVNKMKLTKSQLKGLIEQAIEKITEEGAKPDFLDIDNDGDKEESMKKAAKEKTQGVKLKEEDLDQAQDFSALSSVVQELRMLANGQLDDFNKMAPTEYFKVLADKLDNAMRDLSGASDMASSPMEEQEEVEEGTQPPEEKKPPEETKDDKTAKFLDDMIKKKLRKKTHSPKSPADLVQPVGPKLEESNDTWYNSSLYESLRTKWAKKGDK